MYLIYDSGILSSNTINFIFDTDHAQMIVRNKHDLTTCNTCDISKTNENKNTVTGKMLL